MAKVDRRIAKTQEALKRALLELKSEKNFDAITIQDLSDRANVSRGTIYLHYQDKYDLLDKLIATHIHELQKLCAAAAEMDYIESTLICTEYFENNFTFFSMMLASKGAPYFRNRYLEFLIEEFGVEVDVLQGKNKGLSKDILVRFVSAAYVEVVEWWFRNDRPIPHQDLANQLGELLERNL